MSEGTFNTIGDKWRANKGEATLDDEEVVEETVEEEVVVEEEEPVRVTTKPETGTVKFKVLRPFGWGGHKFVVGEAELDEEDFDQMMYELNLRTDRLIFVERLG